MSHISSKVRYSAYCPAARRKSRPFSRDDTVGPLSMKCKARRVRSAHKLSTASYGDSTAGLKSDVTISFSMIFESVIQCPRCAVWVKGYFERSERNNASRAFCSSVLLSSLRAFAMSFAICCCCAFILKGIASVRPTPNLNKPTKHPHKRTSRTDPENEHTEQHLRVRNTHADTNWRVYIPRGNATCKKYHLHAKFI